MRDWLEQTGRQRDRLHHGKCVWHVGGKTIRATPGTFLSTKVSDKPARVLMTVSPPEHEHYFEELGSSLPAGLRI
ncbi:hypothetical protein ABID08_005633 [Rhizobium binae]|uniref:Uncharacterized protein n=1 Tax=Rhizobium binae TaxID=1138190 RepID=A0ABV2MP65_9HYPH